MKREPLENYILQSNETPKILQKYKPKKYIEQQRHKYTWFTQFGLHPWGNSYSFLLYYTENGRDTTYIRSVVISSSLSLNLLFLLCQNTDLHRCNTIPSYIARGCLLGKKPKLNITSTIISPPNELPILTTKLQHFTT